MPARLFAIVRTLIVGPIFIGFEEPVLRAKFGDDYIEYRKHVRRWIPRLKPFDNSAEAAVRSDSLD